MLDRPPSGLPAISPSRGEIGSPTLGALSSGIGERGAVSRSPPLRGEMSGRTEGGAKDRGLARFSQ
ncbi:hypothetical protein G6N73_17145 [Mesorhizobium camelthorni]|uniref:Propionyl-coenzyme A carboxylase alpha polypeptide n=1 Tax=Allomesorhizobium camelthorni TaxID=475069 RepID=A0A6G4WDM0_9HYPH|nr:hypothetical protein [Mesorhizobium camelthorni]